MSSPITQRVKTAYKQSAVVKDDKVVIPVDLENKAAEVNKNLKVVEAKEGTVTGQMAGPKMSDEEWKNYLANESDEAKAARHARESAAGVREGYVSQEDADAQNLANQQDQDGDGDGDGDKIVDKNAYLSEKRKTVHKRDGAGNIKRTKNMQARDDERTMKGDYRDIKQMGRQSWRDLDKATKQEYKAAGMTRGDWVRKGGQFQDFSAGAEGKPGTFSDTDESTFAGNMRVNRKHGGSISDMMNKYGGSSDANRQDFNVASDGRREIGASEQISGNVGDELPATIENRERYKKEYGYYPEDAPESSNNQNSSFKQTGFSGFQQNPDSPNQNVGKFVRSADEIVTAGKKKFSKVKEQAQGWWNRNVRGQQQLPQNATGGTSVPAVITGSTTAGGVSSGTAAGLTAAGIVGGTVAGSLLSGNSKPSSEDIDTSIENDKKPEKKKLSKYGTKTWEQGYKDWGGEKKGTMDQFKSEANAWWDSESGQKHAKDKGYKHRIKKEKVTPVNETGGKPNNVASVSTNVSDDFKKTTDTMLENVNVPTTFDTPKVEESKVSEKKVEKLDNRLGRLKDRKVTPKRARKIAKLEAKKAGTDKATIRANKVIDKNLGKAYTALTEGKNEKAVRNYNKAKRHVDKPNPDVVNSLQQKENELKKAAGFKQKGWSGFQQKKK